MPIKPGKVTGVGTPTDLGILAGSNPGFNQGVRPDEIVTPDLALEYTKKNLSTINLDLGTQTDQEEYKVAGTFLWYASALDSSNVVLFDRPITIHFDRRENPGVTFLPGMMMSGIPFDRLFVTIPTGYTANDAGQLVLTIDKPEDRIRIE